MGRLLRKKVLYNDLGVSVEHGVWGVGHGKEGKVTLYRYMAPEEWTGYD